ncbi:MAG: hypothetical protein Q8O40_01055 [Chloroflexota bacterium]|nr:hypothetical protein [Chloroflexota bacterium]
MTAPAGYGKTTLLAQFAQEVDFPMCWMTVDLLALAVAAGAPTGYSTG